MQSNSVLNCPLSKLAEFLTNNFSKENKDTAREERKEGRKGGKERRRKREDY